jgi:MFS family permease
LRESPQFRRLWLSQMCSSFGSQMTAVAVLFQVWRSTGSTVWTGAIGLAQAVPLIAFGLFAGALADRLDRRRFYLAATAGQGVCSALLALQALLGTFPVGVVLLVIGVQSLCGAGSGPTARTFLPHLVPPQRLAAALALNRIAFQGSMMVGPAAGGLVLATTSVSGCYLVDALTFVVAGYGAFRLPRIMARSGGGEPAPRSGLQAVAVGLRYLRHTAPVRGALLTDLATTVLTMPISLFPLINAERFGNNPGTLGLFLTAIAVGGVAASVFSGTFTRLPRPSCSPDRRCGARRCCCWGWCRTPGSGWAAWRSRVPRTRSSRAARWCNCARRTNCSAGSRPPSRSPGRPGRNSATCGPDSSPAPHQGRPPWSAAVSCAWPHSRLSS